MTDGSRASGGTSEVVDVVDAGDRVVATVTRAEMRAGRLRHRAVFVAVLGTDGRILVHQRSFAKDLWPGRWDLAVGGVVAAGESYGDAARRELAEELGIDAAPDPIGGGVYEDADVSLVGRCYRIVHDGPFRFVDAEVLQARWAGAGEVEELRRQGLLVPDSVALVLPLIVPA